MGVQCICAVSSEKSEVGALKKKKKYQASGSSQSNVCSVYLEGYIVDD